MALGGGNFTVQNKKLPGAYKRFMSTSKASATLSERGVVAAPLMLDYGPDGMICELTREEFENQSLSMFGCAYDSAALMPFRELFCGARKVLYYRLNGGGAKASNAFCTAKYTGTAGNKLYTVIAASADESGKFDVSTYFDTSLIDTQTVSSAAELKANAFVEFKSSASLAATIKTALTGGTNGTANAAAYQAFLDKLESYSYNALCCPSAEQTVVKLFGNYTRRMRDEVGSPFVGVIYNKLGETKLADYEGIVEVGTEVADTSHPYALVYWVAGICAGCEVGKSNTNRVYDGELEIKADHTQAQLESALESGRFMLHRVGDAFRVLDDINSLTEFTDEHGEDFAYNQVIRVCDELASGIAALFNSRYLGKVPNDDSGRISFWNEVCKLIGELVKVRAVEDFDPDSVTVAVGADKRSVSCTISSLKLTFAMTKLYLSVIVE